MVIPDFGMTHPSFPVTLAVAVVMDTTDQGGRGLEVWIGLAREVLRSMSTHNLIARNALQGVDAISNRVNSILGHRHPMPSLAESSGANSQDGLKPTQVQLSLAGLLGHDNATNNVWDTIEATVFAGNLPGLEALCSPMIGHAIDDFLTSCLTTVRQQV